MTTAFAGAVLDADGRPFDRIRLTGLSSTGHHGVYDHEKADGQLFRADVVLHLDTREAARGDDLADTVSYAGVAEDVVAVLAGSPADLIETVAERIAATILTHPDVVAVDVAVHKPQAPLTVPFEDVEVVIRRDRVVVPVVAPLARRQDGAGREGPSYAPIPVGSVAPALIHGVESVRAHPEPEPEPSLAEAPAVMPPSIPPSGSTGGVPTAEPVAAPGGTGERPAAPEPDLAVAAVPVPFPGPDDDAAARPRDDEPAPGDLVETPAHALVAEHDETVTPLAAADVADAERVPEVAPAPPGDVAEPAAGPGTELVEDPADVTREAPLATATAADALAPEGSTRESGHDVPPTGAPGVEAPPVERERDRMDDVPAGFVDVVLALGANLGDAQQTLRDAITDLDRISGLEITEVSPLARTAAVGPEQPDFLNAVLLARTSLSARDLLHATQEVERAHGRVRHERWGPRTLDVDLVVYGSLTAVADDLELPHPRAHERAFVLEPWSQIDPDAVLPGLGGGPVAALAATAPDRAGIRWLALDWLTENTPHLTGGVPVTTAGTDVAPAGAPGQDDHRPAAAAPPAGAGDEAAAQPPAVQPPAAQHEPPAPPPAQPTPQPSSPHPVSQQSAPLPAPSQPVPPRPTPEPTAPQPPQQAAPQPTPPAAPDHPQPVPPFRPAGHGAAPVFPGDPGYDAVPPAEPAAPPSEARPVFAPVSDGPVPAGAEPAAPPLAPAPEPPAPVPTFAPVHEPVPSETFQVLSPSADPHDDGIIRAVPFEPVGPPAAAPGPLADPALHHPAPPAPEGTARAAADPSSDQDPHAPAADRWPPFPPVSGPGADPQR